MFGVQLQQICFVEEVVLYVVENEVLKKYLQPSKIIIITYVIKRIKRNYKKI